MLMLLATAAAATLSATPEVRTVAGDTGPIRYVKEARADGTVLLTSAPGNRAQPFRLRVRNGWVSGWVGDQTVSFRAPRPAALRAD